MQKPAAYGASVLVLLVLIHSITVVEAADQHEQVCISPGANGEYNVAYNMDSLSVENPSEVQDLVLEVVNRQLSNGLRKGPDELCARGRDYFVVARRQSSIHLFSYAYCGQGMDRQRCFDCLTGAAQVIEQLDATALRLPPLTAAFASREKP
ncbi:hypothetical protein LINGRAHAP2_LOCUS12154 [Linum grandiflorum]